MQAFKKVDMESWPRREHYRYYTEALKVEFNMTAPVDVQNLLRFCHAHGCKFYAAAIYCVTKALNRIENFRMFKNADGELCVWDKIVPNFTFFHPDDCTFSDCWTDFSEDFPTFYNAITADMQTYKDVKGIKTKPNQPANFYCVSCTPWTAFTGCGSRVADGQPAYFPIVVMGRYEKCGGKVNMPVNITIAHAVADGYHAGLFFRYLQEELRFLALTIQKSTLFFVKSVDFLIHSVQILPRPASAHPPSESPCRLSGSAAARIHPPF